MMPKGRQMCKTSVEIVLTDGAIRNGYINIPINQSLFRHLVALSNRQSKMGSFRRTKDIWKAFHKVDMHSSFLTSSIK